MRQHRVLLVANETATDEHVFDAIFSRWPCQVTLLVPAVPRAKSWMWDEAGVRFEAHRRMTAALTRLRRSGIDVAGVLGDFSPMDAIRDETALHAYDEIVISTLPNRLSRWLKLDLPTRAARELQIPVTHIVADADAGVWPRTSVEPAA